MPDGQQIRLSDLAELVTERSQRAEPDAPYLGLEHIAADTDHAARWGRVSDVTGAVAAFRAGDVLFGRLRPYLRKVVIADRDGFCSPEILVFRPRAGVSARFVHTVVSSDAAIDYATAVSTGSRMPRTSARDMAGLRVTSLDAATAERLNVQMEALSSHKAELDSEEQRMRQLRRAFVAERFASTAVRVTLDTLADVTQGKSLPRAVQGHVTGEVSWFKIADMTTAHNLYGYTSAETRLTPQEVEDLGGRLVPSGSVTFPRVGAAVLTEKKRILDTDAALDENHIVLTPRRNAHPEELLAVMEFIRLADYVQAGAVPSLNLKLVKAIPVVPMTGSDLAATLGAARHHGTPFVRSGRRPPC